MSSLKFSPILLNESEIKLRAKKKGFLLKLSPIHTPLGATPKLNAET